MHTPLQDLLSIVRSGLRGRAARARKVVIVGAGMAGLVAAYELRRAGHEVILLEAARRVGGRILTVREPFSDGLYTEAGAMRIPTTHQLTLAYIDHFRLQTLPFTKTSANAFYFVSGRKTLIPEAAGDPARLGAAFGGPQGGWAAMQSWAAFVRKTRERLQADPDHWEHLLEKYGDISFYQFFRQQGWSANAVTALLVVNGLEPVMQRSFIEMLNLELTWLDADMVQIAGGMDRLPEAFLPALREGIRLGVEVVALDYTSDSVTVHCRGEAESEQVSADCAIIAIPYPALRFVDVIPPFSFGKQSAIRQVHYPNAIKIFLHCRRRFWEEDDGIFGGASLTDLPTRGLYYPDHGRDTGQGVLIGCYTYGEEANRWTALPPEERIAQALKYLAKIHPQITQEFVSGSSKVWREDRWAGGAFAIFDPGQQARLYPHMVNPEGPIHFAGEHTSLKHSWIEGAVESGLRAAQEVHQRAIERTPT